MTDLQKRTWAEISLDNIKHNYETIKSKIPSNCKFLGVVKADAYGHGALEVSRLLQNCGADYLAVSCLDEALELRNGGITMPILILGHTPSKFVETLSDNNITQTVTNYAKAKEYSDILSSLNKNLKIHIKVDTGMSRLGFLCSGNYFDDGINNMKSSCLLPNLIPEGIYTHFATSDEIDKGSNDYTLSQFSLFKKVINSLESENINFEIRHCANSGAVVNHPEMALDMVRPGLLLYGYGDNGKFGLKPCMRFVTTISTIKFYEPGTSISYGRKFTTNVRSRIGVIAAGYADGLPRASSNKCSYYISNHIAPQRGNICMDMCMIDLTDIPEATIGSQVELFGDNNSIYKLADAAETIPYELLCSVTKRVPRIYI